TTPSTLKSAFGVPAKNAVMKSKKSWLFTTLSWLKSGGQAACSMYEGDIAKKILPTPSILSRARAAVSGRLTVAVPLFGKVPSTVPKVAPSSVDNRIETLVQEIGAAFVPPTVQVTVFGPWCSTAPAGGETTPNGEVPDGSVRVTNDEIA